MPHAIAYQHPVQRVLRQPGSRTLRVHHLRKAACLIGSGLHRMQILASSNPRNFAARVAAVCTPARVPVPAPATPATAPILIFDHRSSWPIVVVGGASLRSRAHLYAAPLHLGSGPRPRGGVVGVFGPVGAPAIQDPGSDLPRIHLPRTSVNKEMR